MLSHSIVKQGGTSKSTNSHFGTTHRPRHEVGAERAVAAARWWPAAHRRPAGANQRRSSASYYSCTSSRASVPQRWSCCVDMIQQQRVVRACARHGRCSVNYEPIAWTAKMYRTFRQIPTFAKHFLAPFFKKIRQFLPSVLILDK